MNEYAKGLEHRKIWEACYGKIPEGNFIHHINGNKNDNRIENLQCVTRKEHGLLHRLPNRKRIIYSTGACKVLVAI